MTLSRGFCGEAGTLTPTLSRKRERENGSLSPGALGRKLG
jgi:hypothetical protein